VLIAGGGVAGLETMLGLRHLAGDLVDIELLSPEHYFWYRPLSVLEPFHPSAGRRFDLTTIAAGVGATFTPGTLSAVDAEAHIACTSQGALLTYDVLVVACGTRSTPALAGALTFRGPSDTNAFRGLLGEIQTGAATRIAFALPRRAGWPLPLYELALLTATHVEERRLDDVELSLVTHESAPLALLGPEAVDALTNLLERHGIALSTGCYPVSFGEQRLELLPSGALTVDRVVALARLEGQTIAGIPHDSDGFVATDDRGRVEELEDVYAAGDITRFPIKQGGIAASQADIVANAIALRAGAHLQPGASESILHGILLTGNAPLYLRAELRQGHGAHCTVSTEPIRWPPAKIAGRYLAPFLALQSGLELEV
jgi:sulfide:quinone oxidoreductase